MTKQNYLDDVEQLSNDVSEKKSRGWADLVSVTPAASVRREPVAAWLDCVTPVEAVSDASSSGQVIPMKKSLRTQDTMMVLVFAMGGVLV